MISLEGLVSELMVSPEVSVKDGVPRVTSLKVAEHFGKGHDRVLKDIRKIISECPSEFRAVNFDETFRTVAGPNNSTRQEPVFNLSRDGFTLLAMGFTGKKALEWKIRYIEAFNAMERKLIEASQREANETKKLIDSGYYTRSKDAFLAGKLNIMLGRESLERQELISKVMNAFQTGWKPAKIADMVCVNRRVIYRILRRYSVFKEDFWSTETLSKFLEKGEQERRSALVREA